MKLYGSKSITVNIPLKECSESNGLAEWCQRMNTNTVVTQLVNQLSDDYVCSDEWFFRPREQRRKWEPSWVLMHMRDAIEWIFRVSPLRIQTWEDKVTKVWTFMDIPIWQDFDATFNNKKIHLNWVFSSTIRTLMFPDSNFEWHTLQKRQRDALYNRGQYTFIIWPREWGKSILSSAFVWTFLLKELCMPTIERLRWVQILYYWQSNDSNKRYYKYLKDLLKRIVKDMKYVKFNDYNLTISLIDWDVSREVMFISSLSEAKGRWERPSLVIIDEASRVDEECWKIAIGTTWIPIICISTVNYETRKNWFYDEFLRAEKLQRWYENIDDVIMDIYTKYNLWWDPERLITTDAYLKARNEFYERRPRIALRYTIDDIDTSLVSEKQKAQKIENASWMWDAFVMAEYYWYYVEEEELLPYDWLVTSTMPNTFDRCFIWYDPAQQHDNAAVCIVWIKDNITYVHDSTVLSRDPVIQIHQLKKLRDKAKEMSWWKYVPLWSDVTRWTWDMMVLEDRDVFIDYPIKYTNWKSLNFKWREHLIWKEFLIYNIIRDQFFFKNNVWFSDRLALEWWLLQELSCFKKKNNGKFEWVKSKDDQVNAMMIALYVAYTEVLRERYTEEDKPSSSRIVYLSDYKNNVDDSYNQMVLYW